MRLGAVIAFAIIAASAAAQTYELRGYWADSFHAGYKTQGDTDQMLSRLQTSKANALFLQTRARGDAYYYSSFEPFATGWTVYDALGYAIQQAHAMSPPVEVHAWLNAHTVWASQTPPSNPNHIVNRHPEWLTKDNNGSTYTDVGYGLDFGHPGGADWTARVYMDVLRNYDVDGLHYDYIRYTGASWGYNDTSVARFNTYNAMYTDISFSEWRRQQITGLVRKIWVNAMALKPHVRISAACIPWGNGPTTEAAWTGTSAYSSVFQNWRDWLAEGILDTAIPMCYFDNAQYPTYMVNWSNFLKDHQYNRSGAIGLGNYLNTINQTRAQIDVVRAESPYNASFPSSNNHAIGLLFYSYAGTNDNGASGGGTITWYNPSFYTSMGSKFGSDALVPPMPWKTPASEKGHIRGCLIAPADASWLDSARVMLSNANVTLNQYTDGTGSFAFVDLDPGTYNAYFFVNNVMLKSVTGIVVLSGEVTTVNSFVGSSNGATEVQSIAALTGMPDGALVVLKDRIVQSKTGHFSDRVYVADWANGAGIAVKEPTQAGTPWQVGDIVAVRGALATDSNGERCIQNAAIQMMGFEWARPTRTVSLATANTNLP